MGSLKNCGWRNSNCGLKSKDAEVRDQTSEVRDQRSVPPAVAGGRGRPRKDEDGGLRSEATTAERSKMVARGQSDEIGRHP